MVLLTGVVAVASAGSVEVPQVDVSIVVLAGIYMPAVALEGIYQPSVRLEGINVDVTELVGIV
jgi:hypothetical protein